MRKFALLVCVFSIVVVVGCLGLAIFGGTRHLVELILLLVAMALFSSSGGMCFFEYRRGASSWRLAFRILTAVVFLVWLFFFGIWIHANTSESRGLRGAGHALEQSLRDSGL